jgi:cytochrome c1
LRDFAKRPLIAGVLPNTPEIVVQWLREPKALRPRTLMPDLHVTAQHAQDMQAYLATLE